MSGVPLDWIQLVDLEVFYRVGVPALERAKPQRLLLTVSMGHDIRAAAAADDLSKTIDYFAVSRRLLALGDGREWRLIETVAVEIAELVRQEFGVGQVVVEVKKFILPEARHVSVRVERGAGEAEDSGLRGGIEPRTDANRRG